MKQKEIIEGNKLIAQFIGLKRGWWIHQEKPLTDDKKQWCDMDGKTFLGTRVYYDKDLKFHESWDWLMPVFEKIEQISELSPSINFGCGTTIWTDGAGTTRIEIFPETKKESNINISWKAVIEFIKWYNENKK